MNQSICQTIAGRRQECERVILDLSGGSGMTASVIRELRHDFGIEMADQLLAVTRLQSKAKRKLGDGLWWVTQRSLQQATPWQVAAFKATWFGNETVFDLCCGVGGDTMQLVSRGNVVAIDLDPVIVAMASANLTHVQSAYDCDVRCEDACDTVLPQGCSLHIDPDRRSSHGRSTSPDLYRPAWSDVMRMIAGAKAAVVKLAPAARIECPIEAAHRCWISLSGSVREQSLICGDALDRSGTIAGMVSAVRIHTDGSFERFMATVGGHDEVPAGSMPLAWLVDPDASIRASGLTESFAAAHGLSTLGGPSGFLTGDRCDTVEPSKMANVQRVLWHGPADDRKIRRELRQRDLYPQTIKARGTDHDPAKLTKRYRKCGTQPITLWFGRAGGRVFAAFTESA